MIKLGTANKPHGIKGSFFLILENAKESILKKGMQVTIQSTRGHQQMKIASISFGGKTIASFEGIETREALEPILPFDLFVDRAHFPKLPDDEIYLIDLVGAEVFSTDKQFLGVLEKFYSNGINDIAVITRKNLPALELPFVKTFFIHINYELKQVFVSVPEYI
jgi:16S rRNA processing protein RimM